jgi:hypothetical protein
MSVREVGTLLKWPDARITELENFASSATSLNVPPDNNGVGFVFESSSSSSLTRITVSARSARTPSSVGVGSTLPDVVRVFGGDPRTEFRGDSPANPGGLLLLRRSGPRCLIATVDYDAANARVMVGVEYRDRGIEFVLFTTAERTQLLVDQIEIFAPKACEPGD